MEKYFRPFLIIILMGIASLANAQIYVTDDNFADSVGVYQITVSEDGKCEYLGEEAFKLPMGETVKIERLLEGQPQYALVIIDGKEYGISGSKLLFSDENPEGTEDIFGDTRSRVNHSAMGKFFATMTPYWMIAILFIVAMAFIWIGLSSETIRKPALIIVPCCILLASVLEVWAYWVMGTSAFWWCDPEIHGFFGGLFRVLPFIVFVAFQLYSIKFYMRLLTNDENNKLSVKPLLLSIGLCVPIALAVTFLCAGVFGLKSTALGIVTVVTFLLSLGIGLYISTKKNLKELGKASGTFFTLFSIVWAIGAVVALIGLIMVVFKLLFQILIVAVGVILMSLMSTRRYKDSWGNVYEEDGFGNRRRIR